MEALRFGVERVEDPWRPVVQLAAVADLGRLLGLFLPRRGLAERLVVLGEN